MCRFRRDRVSILPGDRLEFIGDRLRFEKSSPRWKIIGREEIEEMEEGSTEIGRQRSKDGALKQARYAPGRPPGRPVCTTCTGLAQSTVARSGRPPGRPTESKLLSVWLWSTARSTVDMGRSTDKRLLAFLLGFGFLFCLGSNSIGLPKTQGLCGYK